MKSTSLPPNAVLLLLALAAGPPAAAQHGQQSDPPLDQQFPGLYGMAEFGKIVSGEFTGDLKRDAVVFDGADLKLLVTPEAFETAISVGAPANDVAVYPGVGGAQDRILTVGTFGLKRYERDSENSAWIEFTVANASSTWAGARLVAVGEINGTGARDAVGVAANGTDVLVRWGTASGWMFAGPTFSTTADEIYGLHVLNWTNAGDTAGMLEVALVTDQGPEIWNYAPTTNTWAKLEGISWTAPIVATVIQDGGTTLERLAMVSPVSGIDVLYVYGDVDSEGPTTLGAIGVVSMAAGDADADGDTELFLGVDTERNFKMLENYSTATSFVAADMQEFEYGPATRDPSINLAGLTTGDFDNDGGLDALVPAQGDLDGVIAVFGRIDLVNVSLSNPASYRPAISGLTFNTTDHQIEFRFTAPSSTLTPASGTELQLLARSWRTEDLGEPTVPDEYDHEFLDLPAPESTYAMPLPAGWSPATSTDVFTVVVRQVLVETTTGDVVQVAPARTFMYTGQPNWPTIRDSGSAQNSFPATRWPDTAETGNGGSAAGPPVPPPDEDDQPDRDDPPRDP